MLISCSTIVVSAQGLIAKDKTGLDSFWIFYFLIVHQVSNKNKFCQFEIELNEINGVMYNNWLKFNVTY